MKRLEESRAPISDPRKTLVARLTRSEIYRDYERAFTEATGLPLTLRLPGSMALGLKGSRNEGPFCMIMGRTNQTCAACLQMQERLEKEAGLEPKTLKCFAGLCDTAVPVRVGDNLIAFLQTGQILVHQPSRQQFTKLTRQLLDWGVRADVKRLEEAYFATRVLSKKQYESAVRLLEIFAKHLATLSNRILLDEDAPEPPSMERARRYIGDHSHEDLSLGDVAKAVNMSAFHFCRMFKRAAGISFTEYIARMRIEKAKSLLLNPNRRISEAAFEAGFQSLSQFNRVFLRVVGCSPTTFRSQIERGGTR